MANGDEMDLPYAFIYKTGFRAAWFVPNLWFVPDLL